MRLMISKLRDLEESLALIMLPSCLINHEHVTCAVHVHLEAGAEVGPSFPRVIHAEFALAYLQNLGLSLRGPGHSCSPERSSASGERKLAELIISDPVIPGESFTPTLTEN